ncbi:ATP-binding cassette domain-containing protein [Nakamurella sp. YIM 132087]|uniref:ATP-binding cassette domain-containing protein n=1 Tax=Nakamurella alba TaxID=2665158 RepID=A0A7K1FUH3_9ACTN|nr:ATP-binding cassette domain-containing protein [Nakamurella alba]MTD16853.1 ATP-binding cassette domain-containing protein [Nakamurella alba]
MTAAEVRTMQVSTPLPVPPGGDWYRVLSGAVVVRPVDDPGAPGVAVLQAGEVVVAAGRHTLLLDPVGSAEVLPLDPADFETLCEPDTVAGLRSWFGHLADAAGGQAGRSAVESDTDRELHLDTVGSSGGGADSLSALDLISRTDTLLDAVAVAAASEERSRSERMAAAVRGAAGHTDRAAVGVLADAVPQLRRAGAGTVVDPIAAALVLLGVPVEAGRGQQDIAPGPDPLDDLEQRADRGRRVVRRVQLVGDPRKDLAAPTATLLAGRLVVLVPAGIGARVVDPATGAARRLRSADLPALGSEGLVGIVELPRRTGLRELGRLAVRGSGRDLALAGALALAAGLLALLLPQAGGAIFSSIAPARDHTRLAALVAALIGVLVATALIGVAQGHLATRIRTRVDASAGNAVFARLLRLPATFFARHGAGKLLTRAGVVDHLRQIVGDSFVGGLVGGVTALFSVGLILAHSTAAGLLTLGLVVVQVLVVAVVVRKRRPLLEESARASQDLAGLTLETMKGVNRIRAFAAEERVMERVAGAFATVSRLGARDAWWSTVLTTMLAAWSTIGVLAVTVGLTLGDSSDPAGYIVLTTALGQVLAGVGTLTTTALSLMLVKPQLDQLRPILDEIPEQSADPEPDGTAGATGATGGVAVAVPELRGGVELSSVSFRYAADGPLVLDDVSIAVRPGEFVAIVGPSGSGKSTLLRLLLGFEQPGTGVVSYDGTPLDRLDVRAVRRQIGTVLQHGGLFPGSLADNIKGGRPLTSDEIWQAADAAQVGADIRRMPMGLHTFVVEGAATLSGGQRQRLIIARALAGAPSMLYLDEATSALDNITQAAVAESLSALDVTRVVIAHRLSTVRDADRILVLDGGRVVQAGSYHELIDTPGLFADLARRQMLEEGGV